MYLAISIVLTQKILYSCNRTRQIVLSKSSIIARNIIRICQKIYFENLKVKQIYKELTSIIAFYYNNKSFVRKLHKSFFLQIIS